MTGPSAELLELDRILGEAGRIAQRAREDLRSELKPDGSIVTNGDRLVETYLRQELRGLRPGASFWGEEFGFQPETPEGLWCIDPVDGTSNYSFGSPIWGVTAGLVHGEGVRLGAVVLPDLGETYLADEHGTWMNGVPMAPIPPGPIKPEELVSASDPILRTLIDQIPGKLRNSGAFVVDAMWVARQRFRGLVGQREKLYDVAASLLILRNLGADIRYADGAPLVLEELKDDRKIGRPWLMFPSGSDFLLRGD